MKLKLATWNLALPVAPRRREAMRAYTDREQADVWVLTETHDGFSPGHGFSHSSAAGRDGLHNREHRWVTIWSRYPLDPLPISDEKRTAAARIKPESGPAFVIYGTVLPWIGSTWQEHPSAHGGRVPTRGVSPQPGQAELHGTQRATADSRVGTVSQSVCSPSSCI